MSADVVKGLAPLGLTRGEGGGFLAGAFALAVLMTASGAFNTDQFALPHRFTLWLVVASLAVWQTLALDALLSGIAPPTRLARIGVAPLAVLGVIGLMTFELHALKFTPLLPYEPDPLPAFALFVAPPIGAIAGVVAMLRVLTATPEAPPPALIAVQPRVAGYLPAPNAPRWPVQHVLRVRAHDHYLEVVTSGGRSFVRGRMKDALRALTSREGVQPHRSWWVAAGEIAGVRRAGRDYVLMTHDGAEIPVARSRVAALRAAGLI